MKCMMFRCGGSRVVGWAWVRISWQKMPERMQSNEPEGVHGERGRTRTCDPCLKRALLYQLSYAPICLIIRELTHYLTNCAPAMCSRNAPLFLSSHLK